MNFSLTPEQEAVRKRARQVAQEVKATAAALLTLKAAWLKDQGRPFTLAAAMAKKFATDTAMAADQEGLQIIGGDGYLKDYPLERFFRDAKAGQIYKGTNEIMRLIIAWDLLKGE